MFSNFLESEHESLSQKQAWSRKNVTLLISVCQCSSLQLQYKSDRGRNEHELGLDRTGAGLKPILAGSRLNRTERIFVV